MILQKFPNPTKYQQDFGWPVNIQFRNTPPPGFCQPKEIDSARIPQSHQVPGFGVASYKRVVSVCLFVCPFVLLGCMCGSPFVCAVPFCSVRFSEFLHLRFARGGAPRSTWKEKSGVHDTSHFVRNEKTPAPRGSLHRCVHCARTVLALSLSPPLVPLTPVHFCSGTIFSFFERSAGLFLGQSRANNPAERS